MTHKFLNLDSQYKRIESSLKERFQKMITHKQFINGPEVQELEEKLATFTGVSFVLCTNSGTSSLILSLMAAGIQPGDEVITSPLSFGATAMSVILTGAVPVFVDIEEETGLIEAHKIEEAISEKTKVILPVSLYGQVGDIDTINQIAKNHSLTVIEDACQSFGASYKGRKSGSLAHISAVSFFPAKPLGAYGNAGGIFTDNKNTMERLKKMRNHGQSKRFVHETAGFNALMNTFQAITLLSKLEFFEEELKLRREKAKHYDQALKDLKPEITFPKIKAERESSRSYYVLKSRKRDHILKFFEKAGYPLTVHYPIPLFDQPFIKPKSRVLGDPYIARRFSSEIFSLPCHAYLTETEQEKIISLLKQALIS